MQAFNSLTIRELPKTKKMAVDEMHPVLKMQKSVFAIRFSDLHSMNNKN
jgi:hypothetical protein